MPSVPVPMIRPARLPGPSLALQIAALLLGGLVVAQLVTLALSVALPPAERRHPLAEIAAALRSGPARESGLVRHVSAAPPPIAQPGWVVAERSLPALSRMLGVPRRDLRLSFYFAAPFGGPPPGSGRPGPPPGGFGAAAPDVPGDFVAALRRADGRWTVVQPRAQGWLTPWQRRLALWFLLSFGLVAPIGWLFARRLSRPLDRFADAAEALGRDPSAAIGLLDGPAEIGRAARAFTTMQSRLHSFVEDRSTVIGAISHDLRTPLTRLRFRIEDAPEPLRTGLLDEVEEMEAMIASVIAFSRDASTPGERERVDLRELADDVAEDARLPGADVAVRSGDPAPVEVNLLGIRRVLANLLDNAVKYGGSAMLRVRCDAGDAVVEVVDPGPGLPADELEAVFQPFYRSEAARASGERGAGLGLAVCRSIARAHGGDVRLRRSAEGFTAELRLPLALS